MAFAFHSLHSSSSSSSSIASSSRAGSRPYSPSSSLSSIDRLRRRNLALSLVLVTPSGPISLPLPLQYPEIYDNLSLDSECDDIYRHSNESLNSLPSSRPATPSTLPSTTSSVDPTADQPMAYYTVSSVFNFMKSLVGYPTEPSSDATARVPRPSSRPQVVRTLSWVSQANQEFIRQMDEEDDDDEERPATSTERSATVQAINTLNQNHTQSQNGNASGRTTPEEGVAFLKGSPKLLGWKVDEREEEAAWKTLIADAMEGSIYETSSEEEQATEDPEALEAPEAVSQSKRDLYQTWLNHWDDENVELVWKISVSLYGNHRWELVPVITGSALGTSALSETESEPLITTQEIGVDTSDLFYVTHAEVPMQTDEIIVPVKEYEEMAVQHEVSYEETAVQHEVSYGEIAIQSEKVVYGEMAIQSEPILPALDNALNSPLPLEEQEHANPWAEHADDTASLADNVSISSDQKEKRSLLKSKIPRLSSIASLRRKVSKSSIKNDSSESVKLASPEENITSSPRSSLSRSNSKDSLKSNGKVKPSPTRSATSATVSRALKNSPSLRSITLERNANTKQQRSPSITSMGTATTTTKVAESVAPTPEVPIAKTAPVTPASETPPETAAGRWFSAARRLGRTNTVLGSWRG